MGKSEQKQPEKKAEQNRLESDQEVLERQAFQLRAEGKMLFALEKLGQVMKLEERWYHYFYKAIWLWESNKIADAVKVVEYGLNFDKAKQFYFRYLSADMLFHVAIVPANAIKDIDKSIAGLDQAIRELDNAGYLLFHNTQEIEVSRQTVPKELKDLCPTFLNQEDLTVQVRSLRTRIELTRQSIILFKGMVQTESRVNAAIEKNRERIDSERIRTIELLGIFTAIFAFIFSGVQIFARLPLSEALVLQGGIGLLMIVFFLGVHLVIQPEARTKLLIVIFIILFVLLWGLPFYARFLQNTFAYEAPVVSTVSQENARSVNENKTIEEKGLKGKVGDSSIIQKVD